MDNYKDFDNALNELNASEGWHIDSASYKNMKKSISELSEIINKIYYKQDGSVSNEALSRDNKKKLIEKYAEVRSACEAYASEHNKQSHSTERGAIRYEVAEKIGNLVKSDAQALSLHLEDKKISLKDVFSKSRNVNISIDTEKAKSVGSNLSSRIPIEYKGHNDESYKGFFTKEEYYNRENDYNNTLNKISKINEKLISKNPKIAKIHKYVCNFAMNHVDKEEWNHKNTEEALLILKGGNKKSSKHQNIDKKLQENNNDKDNWLQDKHVKSLLTVILPKNVEIKDTDKADIKQYITGYIDLMSKYATKVSVMETAGIEPGSEISGKNVAMSVMADLLGASDVLAKSEAMTININGKEVKGVFMETVDAVDPNHVKNGDAFTRLNKGDLYNVNSYDNSIVKKQLSKIQMLDYICGNTDRHIGNLFIELDTENKYNPKVIGIKGIDNDCSFGNIKANECVMSTISPNNMLALDYEMGEKILSVKPDDIRIALTPYINKKENIEAAIERLENAKHIIERTLQEQAKAKETNKNDMKKSVKRGEIKLLREDEWNEYPLDMLKSPEKFEKLSKKLSEYNELNKSIEKLNTNQWSYDEVSKQFDACKKAKKEYYEGWKKNYSDTANEVCNLLGKEKYEDGDEKKVPEKFQQKINEKINVVNDLYKNYNLQKSKYGDLEKLKKQLEAKISIGKYISQARRDFSVEKGKDNAFRRYPSVAGIEFNIDDLNIQYVHSKDNNLKEDKVLFDSKLMTDIYDNLMSYKNKLNEQESIMHSGEYKQMIKALNDTIDYTKSVISEDGFEKFNIEKFKELNKKLIDKATNYADLQKKNPSEKEKNRKNIAGDIIGYSSTLKGGINAREKTNDKELQKELQKEEMKPKKKDIGVTKFGSHNKTSFKDKVKGGLE